MPLKLGRIVEGDHIFIKIASKLHKFYVQGMPPPVFRASVEESSVPSWPPSSCGGSCPTFSGPTICMSSGDGAVASGSFRGGGSPRSPLDRAGFTSSTAVPEDSSITELLGGRLYVDLRGEETALDSLSEIVKEPLDV